MSTFTSSSHATRGATVASDSDRSQGNASRKVRTQSRLEVDSHEPQNQVFEMAT